MPIIDYIFSESSSHYKNKIGVYLKSEKNCAFIVKSENDREYWVKEYSKEILINNIEIIIFDELKEMVLSSEIPVIAEDKRLFAFFQSLSPTDREFFNIDNYFQSIEVGLEFYNLFEELNSEQISYDDVSTIISNNKKQKEQFDFFIGIRERLKFFLNSKNLTDKIFTHNAKSIQENLPSIRNVFNRFDKIILLDCFAVNKFDSIIFCNIFNESVYNKKIIFISPLPEILFDKSKLSIDFKQKNFSFKELVNYGVDELNIFQSSNDIDMFFEATKIIEEKEISAVINLKEDDVYNYLADRKKFNIKSEIPFFDSNLYVFFDILYKIIDDICYCSERKIHLLNINTLFDALNNDIFVCYYIKKEDVEIIKHNILNKISDNYLYIDLKLNLINENTILDNLVKDIDKILKIKNIDEFKKFCYDLNLLFFCKENSSIFDTFFIAIEDFESIEILKMVDSWERFFSPNSNINKIGISFIKLLLDYLKAKNIELKKKSSLNIDLYFSSKFNYNCIPEKLVILNFDENTYPTIDIKNSFFSDNQRRKLALKTPSDIIFLQKLKFFYIVIFTKKVFLFFQKNIEKDKQSSSFLEELIFFAKEKEIHYNTQHTTFFNNNFDSLFDTLFINSPVNLDNNDSDFYIKLDVPKDFPSGQIELSYSSFTNFCNDELSFYLSNIIGLLPITINNEHKITGKILGILIHDILNFVFEEIIKTKTTLSNTKEIEKIFDSITKKLIVDFREDFFIFKIPNNFSKKFLTQIIIPLVRKSFSNMMSSDVFNQFLKNENIKIIPEIKNFVKEQNNNTITKLSDYIENTNLKLLITARSDLRVETENEFYIFDYKSGRVPQDKLQLLFYEYYYYLSKKINPLSVKSYYYSVFEREFSINNQKNDIFEIIIPELSQLFTKALFVLPKSKSKYNKDYIDIYRTDRY